LETRQDSILKEFTVQLVFWLGLCLSFLVLIGP